MRERIKKPKQRGIYNISIGLI